MLNIFFCSASLVSMCGREEKEREGKRRKEKEREGKRRKEK
jgi:hypothetical protein